MDFLINKSITSEPNPRNVLRLHVVGMSGDADHYETNTRDYKNVEEMLPAFRMMIRGFQTARLYDEKALNEAIEEEGDRLDEGHSDPKYKAYAMDVYSELVGYDVTSEGMLCMPERMYVTWFNDYGEEYAMTILLDNGEAVEQITEYNVKDL